MLADFKKSRAVDIPKRDCMHNDIPQVIALKRGAQTARHNFIRLERDYASAWTHSGGSNQSQQANVRAYIDHGIAPAKQLATDRSSVDVIVTTAYVRQPLRPISEI